VKKGEHSLEMEKREGGDQSTKIMSTDPGQNRNWCQINKGKNAKRLIEKRGLGKGK